MMRYFFACILVLSFVVSSCSSFSKLQKSNNVAEKYAGALAYYDKKEYYKASVLLEEVIPLMRGTEQAEKAQFLYSWCQYKMRNLTLSTYYFRNFTETFPRSAYLEEAEYMYCMSLCEESPKASLDQSNTMAAIEAIQNFIMHHPENSNKDKCNQLIDILRDKLELKSYNNTLIYVRKEDYKAALVAVEVFRKEYPESTYNEELAFLKLETAYKYAVNSSHAKQLERYKQAETIYLAFIDKYPQSTYLRAAERLLDKIQNGIVKAENHKKNIFVP